MKKAVFILFILILSLLYYMGSFTEKETLPFSKEFFSPESPSSSNRIFDLKDLRSSESQGINPKMSFLSTKRLDQLYRLKLDQGIRNVPILSTLLIREADQKQDPNQAMQWATYAMKFSPDLPQPYFELAKIRFHQNPFRPLQFLPHVLKGLSKVFQYYPSFLSFSYNAFYILSNAILMTLVLFGIILLVKYLPLYFYDIRKNLTQEIPSLVFNSFKVLFLFIPFLFRLDMLWAILFWSILLWGYVTKRERQIILLFFILLVYLPFFLRASSSFLDGASSDIILEMHRANYEDWDEATEQKLQTWLAAHPDDPDVLFTVALMEKRLGHYPQAEKVYQKAIQQSPNFSEAYSNLGNVYLAKKEISQAIASYQQAIRLNSTKGAYYYNLYRTLSQEILLSPKTEQALKMARQLDAELVDQYLNLESSNIPTNINRVLIDEVLTSRRLGERFWAQFIGGEGLFIRLVRAWFDKTLSRIRFLLPILFLGFLIGMSRYSRAKRFLTRCPMCGSPTHRFYMGTSSREFICFNCHRMFIQKEKLHPRIVEKKSKQARQFQEQNHFIGRFLSFFFVGFGYLWKGYFFRGFLFTLLFFIFILRFAFWNGVLTFSIVRTSPSYWNMIFWGGLFIFIYFFSLRQIYRLQPAFETERGRG